MNISKYVDFYLVEKTSKKTNTTYYAIVMRLKDTDYVLQFLNKDRYDMLTQSLN